MRHLKRNPSEHQEQVAFIHWFRLTQSTRILAIPNGGWRDPITAARLKAEGVSPGVPDLYVPEWRLWIEMKRVKGGSVSSAQKSWIAYLISIGDTVMICKGCSDAIKKIELVGKV